MKKQTLYIIITLVIALVLGGLLLMLFLTDPARDSDSVSAESSASGGELIVRDEATLVSVEIDNIYANYTVVHDTEAEEEDETDTFHYTVEEYEKYGVKSGTLASAIGVFTNLSYTKEIGEVADPTIYGLNGDFKAKATYSDGTTEELVFGSVPGESSGRYVLYNGKVYICNAINTLYLVGIESHLGSLTWTIDPYEDESGNTFNYLNYISLKGTNFEREIEMTYDSQAADYVMTKPVAAVASVDLMETIANSLAYISTYSVAAVEPDEAKMTELGFGEPYCELNFNLNGHDHSIVLGNQYEAGYRYCYIDGDTSIIYTLAEDYYLTWAETSETKFRDGYVLLKMINTVDQFTVEADGKTAVVDITRTVDEEYSTDETTYYNYTATLNGKDVEYDGTVNYFFQDIIAIPFVSMTDMEITGDPVITVRYEDYDGGETVLEYYKAKDQDTRYVAYINGAYSATVRDTSIQDFLKSFGSFMDSNA